MQKPGIYTGITNSDYHATGGISSTYLRKWSKCPLATTEEVKETKALLFGSAAHKYILEPNEFYDEFAVTPAYRRQTKTGKKLYSEFLKSSKEKGVISFDEFVNITKMDAAIDNHEAAREALTGGVAEQSIFWIDEQTGLLCKCRPDLVLSSGVLVDYKTTADASKSGFERSIEGFGYHQQAAHYLDGYSAATGEHVTEFCFVAQEKTFPFLIGVYYFDEEAIDIGRRKNREAMVEIELSSGDLPSYNNDEATIISLPSWALHQASLDSYDDLMGFES